MQPLDLTVVAVYAIVLMVLAQWVSREKAGHEKNSSDYFLAGRALPWWAIGASLIAANISAEQIIGMSGSAWVMGIAIGAYVGFQSGAHYPPLLLFTVPAGMVICGAAYGVAMALRQGLRDKILAMTRSTSRNDQSRSSE